MKRNIRYTAIFAAIAAILWAASTVFAAPLPWAGLKDAINGVTDPPSMIRCDENRSLAVVFLKGEAGEYALVMASTGEFLFIFDPDPTNVNAIPTEIGRGILDSEQRFAAVAWKSTAGLKLPINVCKLFYPNGA